MNPGHGYQGGDCVTCGVSSRALRNELEVLRRRLLDRDVAIVQLETQMAQERPQEHYPQGQVAVLRAQCDHWQDKYDRLLEAHKRLQKVNQGLEDKLLRLVDRTESEKSSLAADTASLTTALTTAAQAINRLKQENDRYHNDLNLAIQLLQCNPNKYAAHKLDSLPMDLQRKAKSRLAKEPRETPKPEVKVIKVPIPTFPPTAMVYSVNKYAEQSSKEEPVDAVSAAIMAAVLEERQRERARQHCSTCTCGSTHTHTPPGNTGMDDDPNGNRDASHAPHTPLSLPQEEGGSPVFRVSVVDVGTQVFPSYIGETGKVQSTCIYCHHSSRAPPPSHATDRSAEVNGKPARSQVMGNVEEESPGHPPKTASPDSAWEWPAEGQDSGSPSTPSSLVSASLSYESETSNVTSPQESPGRLSLPPKPARSQGSVDSPRVERGAVTVGSGGTVAVLKSPLSSPSSGVGNGIARQGVAAHHPAAHPAPSTLPATMTTSIHHHNRHNQYHHRTSTTPHHHHRLQFNARSPGHDAFTPPIHRSPPQPHRETQHCWPSDVIASSTYTSSSTETTL
ncbi:tight junction-associated protein 1-like isoform X1 [Scylla paramamosain]|uniref:tight junction-associated protein 1-like isoform X1 n=1 Tax=Scylla paramamosain TaxID=85552 RepID=UPI0030832AD3